MNDYGKRWLIEQMGHDHRDSRRTRGNGRRDRRDKPESNYEDYDDYEDYADYEDYGDYADSRRGSSRRDMRDYEDYHDMPEMKLKKSEGNRWLHEMENTDGTKGPHYTMQEVMHAAEKLGIRFNEFSEREFFIAVNMWYSDYGHVTKRLVGDNKDKELMANADYAKAFLDDPDGAEGSEKLAITYHCMRGKK